MTTNNAINSPLPTTLANGGTNANLTASNGGIFYSTASAAAILSGTATANQILLSGSSTTPAWSTVTHPATTTVNQILYSSSTNVIGGITTANSAVLVTNSSGVPAYSGTMTNGQLIIGNTSGTPTAATLTAGANITITNGAGTITIAASGAGASGSWVKLDSKTASNSTTLDFAALFSATYNTYIFLFNNILPATNEVIFELQLGTGAGPTWITTGYQSLDFLAVAGGTGVQVSTTNFLVSANSSGGATTQLSSTNGNLNGILYLYGTNATSALAFVTGSCTYIGGSGAPTLYTNGGSVAAATYTSARFLMSSGNITSGTITAFGLTP